MKKKWQNPFYLFPEKDFDGLIEIFKEGIGEQKGHFQLEHPSFQTFCICHVVYEKEELNHMTKSELKAYFKRMIEETGCDEYGETVLPDSSHITIQVGNGDDCLHFVSLKIAVKNQGIGTRIIVWLENYAKREGYKGLLLRSTENEAVNHIAVKRDYQPVYTTVEERIELGKRQGFKYDPKDVPQYDSNGNLYGHYLLTFN